MAGTLRLRLEDTGFLLRERFAARSLKEHLEGVAAGVGFHPVESDESPYLVWDPHYPCLSAATLSTLREDSARTGKPVVLAGSDGDFLAAVLPTKMAVPGPSQELERRWPLPEEAQRLEPGLRWMELERYVIARHVASLAASGVYFEHMESVLVDTTVAIAPRARIGPNVVLRGACRIERAQIQAGAWLEDTVVANGAVIKPYSVCEGAQIGAGAQVGPMAHLRAGTVLGADVKIGNFVETKKAVLDRGAKASHLTYLGDVEVGADANIGAGTITCNYDGHRKHETRIGRGAFIGSNTALVAPVKVGDGAMVGAGSVITRDVPDGALAVERAPLRILEGRGRAIEARNREAAKKEP